MMLLHEILKPERKTAIVDVGAAAYAHELDGPRPYENLLQLKIGSLIGFEPQTKNWPVSELDEIYYPDIIGDGAEGMLRTYKAPWLTSLFEPHPMAMDVFRFKQGFELVRAETVQTRRLDDIEPVRRIDFLKIDAQGSELAAIQGAAKKLFDAVFVQMEVQFIPLYKNQPMFTDLHCAMERRGFMLHTFFSAGNLMIGPYVYVLRPDAAMRQIMHADAVYVRDFSRLDLLQPEQVKQMALIAHYCYGSFDLAYRCVLHLLGREVADKYIREVERADGQGNRARESDDRGAGAAPVLRH